MGLTKFTLKENDTIPKINYYEATVEFISMIRDVLKDPALLEKAKKELEILYTLSEEEKAKYAEARELIDSHQKILDANSAILIEHKASCKALELDKEAHKAAVEQFAKNMASNNATLADKEREIEKRDFAVNKIEIKHKTLADELSRKEDELTKRERIVNIKDIENKKAERENTEFKAKLDARYSQLTRPLD